MKVASNIYNFSDYRDFLKDRYAQLKEADPAFSFRNFSKQAGFGSPNYLKLVMDGKRNLSDEAIVKFAKGLRLDNHESEYLKFMVQSNQCDNLYKKRVYEAKLIYLRELFKVKDLIPELYEYYHDWFHAAIREMVKAGPVKNDPAGIGQNLVPSISAEEANRSVQLLKQLGMISESRDGMLSIVETKAEGGAEVGIAQKIYHEQMAELATQSLYTQNPADVGFESVTVSLTRAGVQELKVKIAELVASISNKNGVGTADAVYQLNVQLFALTRPEGEEESTLQIP